MILKFKQSYNNKNISFKFKGSTLDDIVSKLSIYKELEGIKATKEDIINTLLKNDFTDIQFIV